MADVYNRLISEKINEYIEQITSLKIAANNIAYDSKICELENRIASLEQKIDFIDSILSYLKSKVDSL